MNFEYAGYLPLSILIFIILLVLNFKNESNFFVWIKDHWFLHRSKKLVASTTFFWIGIFLFTLALHDFRGQEQLIEGSTTNQRTILLIDTSASMGVEDVRPSRFEKALLLARHFVKRAAGHQLSIVVFSDKSKRIIPFTEDTDLIDARLQSLRGMNLNRGGTALGQAIEESINYFISNNGTKMGNIVVFSDGEEHETFTPKIPKEITVAMIGIGTAKGGPVPIRDHKNVLRGHIRHGGGQVISKLSENFFKKMKDDIDHSEYWIASSYSLPTSSIRNFLDGSHNRKIEKSKMRIKPVMMEWLMIPGVLFIILSNLLKFGNLFKYLTIICLFTFSAPSYSQDGEEDESEIKPTVEMIELEREMMNGDMREITKKRLVQEYIKSNDKASAEKMLGEVLSNEKLSNKNKNHYFNLGTLQLENKKIGEAVKTYNELLAHVDKNDKGNEEFKEKIGKNLLKALQVQAQQQSESEKKKSDKDKKGEGESKSGSEESDGDKNKDKKKKNDKKNDKKDDKDKKEKKDNDKKDNDKKKDGEGKQSDKPLDKKKLPSMLKQLVSDDNKLQKKMIDKDTKDPLKRNKKDW